MMDDADALGGQVRLSYYCTTRTIAAICLELLKIRERSEGCSQAWRQNATNHLKN